MPPTPLPPPISYETFVKEYISQISHRLIGKSIQGVHYYELIEGNSNGHEVGKQAMHFVDMKLWLSMDDSTVCGIETNNLFSDTNGIENIDFTPHQVRFEPEKLLNLSQHPNYKNILNVPISGVHLHWRLTQGVRTQLDKEAGYYDEDRIARFPAIWELVFENGERLWISNEVFEVNPDKPYPYGNYFSLRLAIYFSETAIENRGFTDIIEKQDVPVDLEPSFDIPTFEKEVSRAQIFGVVGKRHLSADWRKE